MATAETEGLVLEAIEALERIGCQFFACDGPTLEPVNMSTCFVCDLLARLRVEAGLPPRRDDELTAVARADANMAAYMATTRRRQ